MVHLPILGIVLKRQLDIFERGLVVAFKKMDQADLIMAGWVARLKRQATLKRHQRLVVAPQLELNIPQVELREKIIFERGDHPKLFGGLGQQAVALVVEAKRVVGFTHLRVARDGAAIFFDGFPNPMGAF